MAQVVAKFKCDSAAMSYYGKTPSSDGKVTEFKFSPVYSSDANSVNRKFWNATPVGKLELGTTALPV